MRRRDLLLGAVGAGVSVAAVGSGEPAAGPAHPELPGWTWALDEDPDDFGYWTRADGHAIGCGEQDRLDPYITRILKRCDVDDPTVSA